MKRGLLITFISLTLLLGTGCGLLFPSESPEKMVEQFFHMEQQGNFGGSWELFHPDMQQIWKKDTYIQLRAKVIMESLGAQSFTFKIGTPQNVGEWTFPGSGTVFYDAQLIPTEMTFHGVFGTLTLVQNFYLVEETGRWHILWDPPSQAASKSTAPASTEEASHP